MNANRQEDPEPARARPLGVWLIGLLALAALVQVVGAAVYLDPAAARAALYEMNVVELSVELIGLLVFLVATVQLLHLERSAVAWFGAAFFL